MASSSAPASAAVILLTLPLAWFAYSFEGCTVLSNDAPLDEAGIYDGGEAGPNTSADCSSCVSEACPGEWSACFASADCTALLECADAPGCDATCQAQCACSNAAGVTLFAAATRCDQTQRCTGGSCNGACAAAGLTTTCGTSAPACGTTSTDSGAVDGAAPVTEATCGSCISGSCGDQEQQCPPDSDCDEFIACGVGCTTASCIGDCGTNHSTGKQTSSQLAQCVTTSCTPQCGL